MKWRRDTFEINLTASARADGEPDHIQGWVSEPFAVHRALDVVLTHLPTGRKIHSGERTIAGAKAFAARLLAAAGDHDWSGPKGANPKKTAPTRRSAWFRKAEEIFLAVYAGADGPTAKRGDELKEEQMECIAAITGHCGNSRKFCAEKQALQKGETNVT